jgi:hypothetical protein
MRDAPMPSASGTSPSAADLRACRATRRMPLYVLAARVQLNPTTLGAVLNERVPLPPDLAERIRRVLEDHHA